jgi:Mrp family chromosome partitioning ATPase
MTRIFEALRKSGRAGTFPFPPVEPAPLRPAVVSRPATPAAAAPVVEPGTVPHVGAAPAAVLTGEVMRQMTALRVGLEAALEGRTSRVVMFVGTMGGEGVTSVATQFAASLADDGRPPCVLLDAHASRPGARSRRAALPSARGAAPERPAGSIRVAALGEGGGRAPAAVRSTLAALSAQYEWVVVDGPPVLEAPESVDLAPLVDGVVLVVHSGHTKRPVAQRAVEMLRKSGVRVVGCVLNRRRLEIPDFIYRRI